MKPLPEFKEAGKLSSARRIGYARVSTEDQKLDLQLDALARAECVRVFKDHGVSRAKSNRPGLEAAMGELVSGDVLIVYKLDRLGRSVLNRADLLTQMDSRGIHFCSLTEGINTTTPGGRLVFHVFAAVAEFVRDMIRENTAHGLAAARALGAAIGRPRKLSSEMVREAERLIQIENCSVADVAKQLRVSESTVRRRAARKPCSRG